MVQEKAFLVALCATDAVEIFSCGVKVDSYTKPTVPDDMITSRATLFRAIEKAMEAYSRHCKEHGEEMREVISVVASYLGVAEK